MGVLYNIRNHADLEKLDATQRAVLCDEIRQFLVSHVSRTGGHLASNLGVVELTVALETVFNTETDRLVFDVGHQSYVHKLLTGRQADFDNLRQYGGMAGFPKPCESVTDSFVAGHASSSVSIALGMARARTLKAADYQVVALIGDGSATGGMAYEGLNDAAVSGEPLIVILNDNAMSIDRNVGGMASHLRNLRTKERYLGMKERYRNFLLKIPGGRMIYRLTRGIKDRLRRMLIPTTIFENMGFSYLGPVDGHDTEHLIFLLKTAREMNRPVLLHVITEKGKGYTPAEKNPSLFHGIGCFDPQTGVAEKKQEQTFSDSFGQTMCKLAQNDHKVCAVTAAMPGGTGLLDFQKQFPDRIFDVGIAEEHAVSMACGLAKQGMTPVVALYSTFLQRAYDMILQDISMLQLHVVLAVDRAGLVGEDGETHHGVFDIGFLRHAPNMKILCPVSIQEQQNMLNWAIEECKGPVAVRYPRGGNRGQTSVIWTKPDESIVCHRKGNDVTFITYGNIFFNVEQACELLERDGIEATVLRLTELSEFDSEMIINYIPAGRPVVVVEEVCSGCGIRESVAWSLHCIDHGIKVYGFDLGKGFVTHGKISALYKHCGVDPESIVNKTKEVLCVENQKETGCTSG